MIFFSWVLPLNPQEDSTPDQNLVTLSNTTCKAFRLSDTRVKVEDEKLSDGELEMPRINYDYNGRKYRYFYGVGFNLDNFAFHSIFKV